MLILLLRGVKLLDYQLVSSYRRDTMDLIITGKYIADKRKSLGLTQKQVAEKLGMSDKSVSKWERGDWDIIVTSLRKPYK